PHEIEREFEHFVTESNDEIYKYQTLCSELRISMLHHGIRPAPKEPKNSNKSLKEESLQQFKQLHNYPETEDYLLEVFFLKSAEGQFCSFHRLNIYELGNKNVILNYQKCNCHANLLKRF
ncbi:MAG: hypothetical protein II200_07775, partial [Bacteroidaceae bacterium]|nr:hypothetical protein [Bacteroidaceae bacterium]